MTSVSRAVRFLPLSGLRYPGKLSPTPRISCRSIEAHLRTSIRPISDNSAGRLYIKNPQLFSHVATVEQLGRNILTNETVHWVCFNETIFHPQGGGQPSDQGSISGLPVQKVVKSLTNPKNTFQFNILHYFYTDPKFEFGQKVLMEIDKDKRIQHMKLHSGGHAIARVTEACFPGLKVTNGHHFPGEARVTFEASQYPDKEKILAKIQKELNLLIAKKIPSRIVSEKEESFHVIEGFPPMGCGGTHVANLEELANITITNIKTSKKKLHIFYQ